MIICVTGWFKKYDRDGVYTGKREFVVSHGIDFETDEHVILPCEHPDVLGAKYDTEIGEYVIY
jgi:hypothetical protein